MSSTNATPDDANESVEWVTDTSRKLTDQDIQRLADEAEGGYEVEKITPAPRVVKPKRQKLGPVDGPRSYRDKF